MAYSRAYATNYSLIDWSGFKPSVEVRTATKSGSGPYFVPDIAAFVSPVNYELITSRSKLREHEKRYGVKQIGSDLKPEDFNSHREPQVNERALGQAFREALAKKGL